MRGYRWHLQLGGNWCRAGEGSPGDGTGDEQSERVPCDFRGALSGWTPIDNFDGERLDVGRLSVRFPSSDCNRVCLVCPVGVDQGKVTPLR